MKRIWRVEEQIAAAKQGMSEWPAWMKEVAQINSPVRSTNLSCNSQEKKPIENKTASKAK